MRISKQRVGLVATAALLMTVMVTGCTLAGARPAPLTPVGEAQTTPEGPQGEDTQPPEPTATFTVTTIDDFGTQTAMAPTPEPSPEPTAELTEPTAEPTSETSPEPTTPSGDGGTAECPETYTVQSGDNIFRIALRFGLTTQQLAAANNISNPEFVAVGTVLTIPGCGDDAPSTSDGDEVAVHVVQQGDNLFRIALQYGLDWQVVADYNGITNPRLLSIGQTIYIPPTTQD